MLIPPTYLRLLDRPADATAPSSPMRKAGPGRLPTALLAAATGAASGSVTAWLVLLGLG
jgi:hypothetical protein